MHTGCKKEPRRSKWALSQPEREGASGKRDRLEASEIPNEFVLPCLLEEIEECSRLCRGLI